jgi:hypothetical protein
MTAVCPMRQGQDASKSPPSYQLTAVLAVAIPAKTAFGSKGSIICNIVTMGAHKKRMKMLLDSAARIEDLGIMLQVSKAQVCLGLEKFLGLPLILNCCR